MIQWNDISIFLNSMLMSFIGTLLSLLGMDALMARRRKAYVWWGYLTLRSAVVAVLDILLLHGIASWQLQAFQVIFYCATAVITYAVYYYTWDTDILKAGLAGIISELFASFCILAGVAAVNLICGRDAGTSYQTALRPDSVPTALACVAFFPLARIPLRLMRRSFTAWEIRHREFWQALAVVVIAVFTGTQFTDLNDISAAAAVILFSLGGILISGIILSRNRSRILQQRRNAAKWQKQRIAEQEQLIRMQLDTLEENRKLLSQYRESMQKTKDGSLSDTSEQKDFADQTMERLFGLYEKLCGGKYTDDIGLDAVLDGGVRLAGENGTLMKVSAQGLGNHTPETSYAAEKMIQWGIAAKPEVLELDIFSVRNQTVLSMTASPGIKKGISERDFRELLGDKMVSFTCTRNKKESRAALMLEEYNYIEETN